MRFLLIILFFVTLISRAQNVKIFVNEKNKEVITPLANTKFAITISDTIMLELTTGSDGLLGKIPLDAGTYKIRVYNNDFTPGEITGVVVSANKTTPATLTCIRLSTLSAEEKKKLGIK